MAKKKNNKQAITASSRLLLDKATINPSLRFRIEEAYKAIRANIMFSVMKKGCKRIVVTSSSPGEGKTTTTVNLAVSISQTDQKVLLIDGDLRKPKIHQYFSVPNAPGLTNYLSDKISGKRTPDLFGVIHPTEYRNLSVLCSGSIPPNPAELLGSELMSDFLDDISNDFDYIIIDTPPVNVVSDCLPVVRESDGVIIVVRSNKSTHPEVQKVISSLEFIDAKILGFVVNFVESRAGKVSKTGYGSYGEYGSYGYSSNNPYAYNYSKYGSYKYRSSSSDPRN